MSFWHICKRLNANRGGKPLEAGGPKNTSLTLDGKSQGEKNGGPAVFRPWEISVLGKQRRKHTGYSKSTKGGLQSLADKVA